MIQAKARTTIVRRAVARSESVFFIPHFARIDVNPANTAESIAAMIQNILTPLRSFRKKDLTYVVSDNIVYRVSDSLHLRYGANILNILTKCYY